MNNECSMVFNQTIIDNFKVFTIVKSIIKVVQTKVFGQNFGPIILSKIPA